MLRRVRSAKRREGVHCDANAGEEERAEQPCRRSLPQVLSHTSSAPAPRVPSFATSITMLNVMTADIHESILDMWRRAKAEKTSQAEDRHGEAEEELRKRSLLQTLPYANAATHSRSLSDFATPITMISSMIGDVHGSIIKTLERARGSKRSKELNSEEQDEDERSKRSLPKVLPKTSLAPRSRSPPGFATQITMLNAMIGDVHVALAEMVRRSANGGLNDSAEGQRDRDRGGRLREDGGWFRGFWGCGWRGGGVE
jgi:hypothetical protein